MEHTNRSLRQPFVLSLCVNREEFSDPANDRAIINCETSKLLWGVATEMISDNHVQQEHFKASSRRRL